MNSVGDISMFEEVQEQLQLGLLHPLELADYVDSMLSMLVEAPKRAELFITTWCKKNCNGESYMNMALATQDDIREKLENALLSWDSHRIDWSHPVILLLLRKLSPYLISIMAEKRSGHNLFYVASIRHAPAAVTIILDKMSEEALKSTTNIFTPMAVATSVHSEWWSVANMLQLIGAHPNTPAEFFSTQSKTCIGVHGLLANNGANIAMLAIENWNLPAALVCMASYNNKCNFHGMQIFAQSCKAAHVFAKAVSNNTDAIEATFSIAKYTQTQNSKRQRINDISIENVPSRVMAHIVSMVFDNNNTQFIEMATQMYNADGHNLMALVENKLASLTDNVYYRKCAMEHCFPEKELRSFINFLTNPATMRDCWHVGHVLNKLYTECLKYK